MAGNLPCPTDNELRESFIKLCGWIAEADEHLKVFVPGTHNQNQVLEQVDQLLALFPDATLRPPMFGVPVGIKDIFHCDGFVTRCGSDLPPELFQGAEAHAVTRLKAAGAIVMGKTATTEFAYFAPAATRNPVNPDHTPGGSSSGSAAGVAAGFFKYALGTQTVGSIIRPAAYCGIAGFKPSLGRIDTAGVVPFSWTVDHVGCFGRTASSLVSILAVIVDSWQNTSSPDRIRLGVPSGPYLAQAEAPAMTAFREQIQRLEEAGCDVIEVAVLDDIQEINNLHMRLIAAEIARVHAPWYYEYLGRYRSVTREIINTGITVTDEDLEKMSFSCSRLRNIISKTMTRNRLDAWVCPAATSEAPAGLETTGSPLMNLPWTHAGLPAITIAAGKGPKGLPLGLQLVGDFMADEYLVALTTLVETMLDG